MCLDCEPENDHGCCRLQMTLARKYAQGGVPKVYARRFGNRVYDTLYTVWMERNGKRIAHCIEACCAICAKADFVGLYFILDEAEVELNRLHTLEDPREGGIRAGHDSRRAKNRNSAPAYDQHS